jgi:hypothetical protein
MALIAATEEDFLNDNDFAGSGQDQEKKEDSSWALLGGKQ